MFRARHLAHLVVLSALLTLGVSACSGSSDTDVAETDDDGGGGCGSIGLDCSADASVCAESETCLSDGTTGVCVQSVIPCADVNCPPGSTCTQTADGLDPICLTDFASDCTCASEAGKTVVTGCDS